MSTFGERVRAAREAMGLSQQQLAEAVGIRQPSVAAIESGKAKASKKVFAMARVLKQDPEWLETGVGAMRTGDTASPPPEPNPSQDKQTLVPAPDTIRNAASWPKDVPVMGVALGGSQGDFSLNTAEISDYIRRPPAILPGRRVFALYVQGDSMRRWREPGDLVYLDPIRPARPGDRVVVELKPQVEGDGHPAYLKELVRIDGKTIKLLQYNPEKTLELPISRVLRLYRVMEWAELLGV